ncbi:MAG: GNAT family N-acetyltransferase, partial [Lachnospiraceae bacterium]|nr:GNAT family N-acetyltransferase [Lachnospiraceae bacterium]
MELTGIGSENEAAFRHLMPGMDIRDYRVAVGAIEEGHAAGVALYNDLDEALMLDYIFVAEEYRRRGIGTALIEEFLEEIKDFGAAALHVNYPEKEKALHSFFSSLDFLLYRDGDSYRISLKKLLKSDRLNHLLKAEPKHLVCPVREPSKAEKQALKN